MICIYHGNCSDGFAGAWVVRKSQGADIEFFKGFYNDTNLPDVKGKQVVMVDFSYKRDQIIEMAKEAVNILILDHHETAKNELINLPENVEVIFDMERSGCMIAWDYYFADERPPKLLAHIQDRDLWNFRLPMTKEIQINLFSYEYDFDVFDELVKMDVNDLVQEGKAILRKHNKDIDEFIEVAAYMDNFFGYGEVPHINIPYFYGSDACAKLCKGHPFAVYYYITSDATVYGMRSEPGVGVNVAEIAAELGGGGHRHAAGFVDRND